MAGNLKQLRWYRKLLFQIVSRGPGAHQGKPLVVSFTAQATGVAGYDNFQSSFWAIRPDGLTYLVQTACISLGDRVRVDVKIDDDIPTGMVFSFLFPLARGFIIWPVSESLFIHHPGANVVFQLEKDISGAEPRCGKIRLFLQRLSEIGKGEGEAACLFIKVRQVIIDPLL